LGAHRRADAGNQYPRRIVSPGRSGPCCFTDMEDVGTPHKDDHWVFQYKRCRTCGLALRVILRDTPDAALAADLRKILANAILPPRLPDPVEPRAHCAAGG